MVRNQRLVTRGNLERIRPLRLIQKRSLNRKESLRMMMKSHQVKKKNMPMLVHSLFSLYQLAHTFVMKKYLTTKERLTKSKQRYLSSNHSYSS